MNIFSRLTTSLSLAFLLAGAPALAVTPARARHHAKPAPQPRKALAKAAHAPVAAAKAVAKTAVKTAHAVARTARKVVHPEPVAYVYAIDDQTGAELTGVSNAPDTRVAPASTTKVIAGMVIADAVRDPRSKLTWDTPVKITHEANASPAGHGSRLPVRDGTVMTLSQAMEAIFLPSANNVVMSVGEDLFGSEQALVDRMNAWAERNGMERTHFANASGWKSADHYSTPRDMVTALQRAIHDYPEVYRYMGEKEFKFAGRTYANHNSLLKSFEGMDGGKTGWTDGFHLIASAVRNERRVDIGVFCVSCTAAKQRDAKVVAKLTDALTEAEKMPPPAQPSLTLRR